MMAFLQQNWMIFIVGLGIVQTVLSVTIPLYLIRRGGESHSLQTRALGMVEQFVKTLPEVMMIAIDPKHTPALRRASSNPPSITVPDNVERFNAEL